MTGFWIYVTVIMVGAVSCNRHLDAGVVADTATGDVAMIAIDGLGVEGQLALPLSTPQLQKASRVFGVRVRQGLIPTAAAKVWLCRQQPPGDCIIIGSDAETEGRDYRIAFRNFTDDPRYQNWKGGGSASLVLHSHDHAWALDVAPSKFDKSETDSFLIVVRARGTEGYAVQLGP